MFDKKCGRRESNPHTFRHQILSLACLPVSPRPQKSGKVNKRAVSEVLTGKNINLVCFPLENTEAVPAVIMKTAHFYLILLSNYAFYGSHDR